ncbi:MAG: hypothetical protein QMD36_00200 [Candidatus Aenigmarchaeota archaeon]|nr:hypothetical protein [Candidatus Aenigmarchaeota archaeon]
MNESSCISRERCWQIYNNKICSRKKPDVKVISVGNYFEEAYKKMGLKRDEGDKAVDREKHKQIQIKV